MPEPSTPGNGAAPGARSDTSEQVSRTSSASPRKHLAVIACMDSRLDVFDILGLASGDAHVIRNAGGLITEDTVRSLALSQRSLGTRDVIIIQHTDCGLLKVTEEELAAEIERDTGAPPPFRFGAFTDLEANLRESVRLLRGAKIVPHRTSIRAFIFDVHTRQLREIDVTRELAAASEEPALG